MPKESIGDCSTVECAGYVAVAVAAQSQSQSLSQSQSTQRTALSLSLCLSGLMLVLARCCYICMYVSVSVCERESARACVRSIIIAFYGFISFVTDIERVSAVCVAVDAAKFIELPMLSLHWQHKHTYAHTRTHRQADR